MSMNLATWVCTQTKATDDEGTTLLVAAVATGGDGSVLGRLGDLGLWAGEQIQYFGRAPLGEPLYICVRETVIALRLDEAALIFVESVG